MKKKAEGTWNISGEEVFTPYEMAITAANYFGWESSGIEAVTAETFSQPGKRPARTGFDISKAKTELGYSPGSFNHNLAFLKG